MVVVSWWSVDAEERGRSSTSLSLSVEEKKRSGRSSWGKSALLSL